MRTAQEERPTRRQELSLFLLLTVVLAPVITIGLIATYGLIVWVSQIIGGPPTY